MTKVGVAELASCLGIVQNDAQFVVVPPVSWIRFRLFSDWGGGFFLRLHVCGHRPGIKEVLTVL